MWNIESYIILSRIEEAGALELIRPTHPELPSQVAIIPHGIATGLTTYLGYTQHNGTVVVYYSGNPTSILWQKWPPLFHAACPMLRLWGYFSSLPPLVDLGHPCLDTRGSYAVQHTLMRSSNGRGEFRYRILLEIPTG